VIFDTTLAVEAQILGHRAVGQLAHVLSRDAVQPRLALGAGERDHRPMRAIDDDGPGGRGPLFAERVAVVPDCAGVGPGFGGRNG
jgi:hypothetical protein